VTRTLDEAINAASSVLGDRARRNVPLGPFTTYRVGGPAALLLEAADEDDLHLARAALTASGLPVLVVGRGSNLLVSDRGFPGLALTLGERFATIHAEQPTVRAGGAVSLPVLARRTAASGRRGLEWAVGVPGSVGGAVRMNAGGHGSDVQAGLTRAWIFDLAGPAGADPVERTAPELGLGYRRSAIRPGQVVVAAEFAPSSGGGGSTNPEAPTPGPSSPTRMAIRPGAWSTPPACAVTAEGPRSCRPSMPTSYRSTTGDRRRTSGP